MKWMKKNCAGKDAELAAALLGGGPAPAKVQKHVAECDRCQSELQELNSTLRALDAWEAPQPSPYFLTRLGARMREEREAAPAGWLAGFIVRLRARAAYGAGFHVRPLAAMALTVILLLGGGAYLGVTDWTHPPQPKSQDAAMVHDLQTLDNNAQVLDQMESLSSNETGD